MKFALALPLLAAGCLLGEEAGDGFDLGKGDGDPTATLAAAWSVEQLATGAAIGCPEGFGIAALFTQRISDTGELDGKATRELFACGDGRGSVKLQRGTYDVWVELRSDAGAAFARSVPRRIVLDQDEVTHAARIYEDAGYFGLHWQLRDGATKQLTTCEAVAGIAAIEVVTDDDLTAIDRFACEAGVGVTRPLLAGRHVVSVRAVDETGAVIATAARVEGGIAPVNAVTDLGSLTIPLPR